MNFNLLFIATGINKRKARLSLKARPLTLEIKSMGIFNYNALALNYSILGRKLKDINYNFIQIKIRF